MSESEITSLIAKYRAFVKARTSDGRLTRLDEIQHACEGSMRHLSNLAFWSVATGRWVIIPSTNDRQEDAQYAWLKD
jgi:hypothetical protein